MATVIKRERGRAPRTLHLDSGDMFQGAPVFNLFNGEVEIRTMGLLGVQGMALGNHEFDKGANLLGIQLMNHGPNFPILAANYEYFDPDDQRSPKLGRFIQPVAVYNVRGIRVGVIGLGNVSSLNSSVEGDNSLGIRARDAKQAVSDLVRVLRPQVDLMVVVSHMGPDDDTAVAREVSDENSEGAGSDPNKRNRRGARWTLAHRLQSARRRLALRQERHLPRSHDHRQQRCVCKVCGLARYGGSRR
jgi:5'-nucleotidase